jgi:AsmA family protein
MRGRFWLLSLFPLVILVLLLVIFWNWDWFIPLVNSEVSAAIGRDVSVQHIGVRFGRSTIVTARGITIGNPKNFPADAPPLAHIDQLRIGVAVMDYVRHRTLSLTSVTIDHPVIAARELPDRHNNYTLHIAQQNTPAHPLKLGCLIINNGTASVVMPIYKTNFDLTIQTRPAPAGNKLFTGGEIVAEAHGTYAAAPITGHFIGGALLTLRDPSIPYPIDLQVRNGTTLARLVGTLDDPERLSGAHLQLSISGQDMADLYKLIGIPVPATPPYSLTGSLDYSKPAFRFKDFYGRMGSSDLEGTITEAQTSPRPTVMADISSHRVDLTDLAGLLGGVPGKITTLGQTAATRAKVEEADARPNLLPQGKFNLPTIKSMDFDVRYRGERIINRDVPLDNVVAHLVVKNGRMTVDPLSFAVGTGTIASNFVFDPVKGGFHTKADIDFHRLQLSRLMAATHTFAGNGTIGGSAYLTGTGDSVAQILGHGDGHATLFLQNGGSVSALLVDLVGLQMGDAMLSALGIPVKTQINCLIADFALTNGLLDTKTFLIGTKAANILGSGTVNLASEQLALQFHTQATHFSIGSLSTPINISGPIKHPQVLPAPGPLAARAGPAAALGLLFPPLALLPTIRLGLGDKNACVDTIAGIHQGEPHNPG